MEFVLSLDSSMIQKDQFNFVSNQQNNVANYHRDWNLCVYPDIFAYHTSRQRNAEIIICLDVSQHGLEYLRMPTDPNNTKNTRSRTSLQKMHNVIYDSILAPLSEVNLHIKKLEGLLPSQLLLPNAGVSVQQDR